ncbi:MAG: NAD(P)-binding domain-containing protein [Clostridia bacterium]|nr:NAD(P)-binding domain-containing protein [Clostridia bacterium]
MPKFAVLGAGRWGTLIAWYINKLGYDLILWGRKNSEKFKNLMQNRCNSSVCFGPEVKITDNLDLAILQEYIIISINAQNFRKFLSDLRENNFDLNNKKIILCMKGIEESTGKRLSEIFGEFFPENKNLAVWVGPGHVKSLMSGIPTCMIIDSENNKFKSELCEILSSKLIKCFKGDDLIGSETGAACKNVLGIGAGILDAMDMQALKGPLMALGSREVSKLIESMGGKKESAFGLCHLGDFQATLFSYESNNRKFGESLITGEKIDFIAEGVGTANAIHNICKDKNLNLPICEEIYKIIHKETSAENSIDYLFSLN